MLSPLGTMAAAGAASYKASAADFWISLLLVQAVGWALVVGAGFRLRSGWREDRGEATVPAPGPASAGTAEPDGPWLSCSWTPPVPGRDAEDETGTAPLPSRPLDEDANPIAWLLQRQRGTRAIHWTGALIGFAVGFAHHGLFRFWGPPIYYWAVGMPLELARSVLEGALFAWAASRFFVEARRTGELELLLTTPLGAREIVSTQWHVLKRLLRWPMLVLLAPTLLEAVFTAARIGMSSSHGPDGSFVVPYAISFLVRSLDIYFGVGALCWVGLWFGLKSGGQARAIVWTVGLVRGLPWLITILWSILFSVLITSAVGRRALIPYSLRQKSTCARTAPTQAGPRSRL